jgi:hypothetical protein
MRRQTSDVLPNEREEDMRRMRISYVVAVALVWWLNGWALLQTAGLVPEVNGLIAGTLLVNILTAPALIWLAYLYGEIAQQMFIQRKRRRGVVLS